MRLKYLTGEEGRNIFLNDFIQGVQEPDNLGLISSSLISDFQLARSAYETARSTRTQHLTERIRLIAERDEALQHLRVLITQTVTTLKLQIRKGVYPKTVLTGFGMGLTGFRLPTRKNQQVPMAETLAKGHAYLSTHNLQTLNSPRLTELQAGIDRVKDLDAQITATRNQLQEVRQEVKQQDTTINALHYRGNRELDNATLDRSKSERRELKRVFGYSYKSTSPEEEPTEAEETSPTEEPTTDHETP